MSNPNPNTTTTATPPSPPPTTTTTTTTTIPRVQPRTTLWGGARQRRSQRSPRRASRATAEAPPHCARSADPR
eukprot:scaffold2927_cov27-Phaeocystis_antarctica.AAC.1